MKRLLILSVFGLVTLSCGSDFMGSSSANGDKFKANDQVGSRNPPTDRIGRNPLNNNGSQTVGSPYPQSQFGDNFDGNMDDDASDGLTLNDIDVIEDDEVRDCLLNFNHNFSKDILNNIVKREINTDVPAAALAELVNVKGQHKEHVVVLNIKTIADAISTVSITNPKAFVCINRSPGTLPVLGIPSFISATAFFKVKTNCVHQVNISWQGVVHAGDSITQEGSKSECAVKK